MGRERESNEIVFFFPLKCLVTLLFFQRFAIELTNSVGDVLMAAACVAYQGAFTSKYRLELTQRWEQKCMDENIPSSENFK